MTTITQTITSLPTAPDRSSPSTFSDRADAFLDALPDMVTEENTWAGQVNTVAGEINTNAATCVANAALALAAANFKGSYTTLAALAGAATVPYSVSHLNKYWMLLSDLANIATKVPGTDSEWAEIRTLPIVERKTAGFTAETGKLYKVDAGITVTLPASPADNDQIWFSSLDDMTADPATIACNGNKIMGLSEDMTWDANASFSLIYDLTLTDWRFA